MSNANLVREPTWEMISKFGKNKLVKSSFLWFVLIPIIAKAIFSFKKLMLSGLVTNDWIKFIDSLLTLPFQWKALYYASVIFVFANVLCLIFCPKLLQKFDSWQDYDKRGTGLDGLVYYYSNWLKRKPKIKNSFGESKTYDEALDEIFTDCSEDIPAMDKDAPSWLRISELKLNPNCELQQVYWLMTRHMLRDKPLIRWSVSCLYLIGILFLVYVLSSNFVSVFKS